MPNAFERGPLALADAAQLADAVPSSSRSVIPAALTPPRRGTGTAAGRRRGPRARRRGSARRSTLDSSAVTSSSASTAGDQRDQLREIIADEVLEQRLGGGGDVAADGDDAVTAHDAQPVALSDGAGRGVRGPYGLGHLAGDDGLGGPAHRQHVGRGVDLGVVGHQRGESLGHRPGRHDAHGLGGERVDLFGDGDDVLVAREQDDVAGVGLFDGGEQLGRRRVEGLAPGDDDLHAEVAEQRARCPSPLLTATTAQVTAGKSTPRRRCRQRPSTRRARPRGWRARRRPPRTGR